MSSPHVDELASQPSPPLTVTEVATQYRTTSRTVQRWIREGRLKAVRLPGGSYRIYQADLDAAISSKASA